ncbi:transcription factor MYB35 isoform X2 [Olea europaea var. sylvestris]|uniref:transcription factor MYB35 isoform X2 n=1 Tax=Olea europaea var. sylvestris TaxID=158386 RepID=UPI000C1D7F32|nr:transcription factor MYB35 isoform X2 [Olea europaea var. sylvestris]
MVKTTCLDKQKEHWNQEENGKLFSGLRKCGKSCRQKWAKNQKTDTRNESFSPQEEELIIKLHAAIGSRWPIIAQQLPGRTDNDVKTLWNTKLRKKLSAMGIDPVTHKPFSQILADYGNIGAFPKARMQFTSSMMLKSEQPQKHNQQTCPNVEPFKDNSLHLYSQFQAINLVTDSTNYTIPPQSFMTECASSSTSPSSTMNQASTSSFNWSDFLLQDVLVPDQENAVILAQNHANTEEKQDYEAAEDKNNETSLYALENLSSSNGSFVEAMIARQDEMFLQFPTLYEEPSYY